MLKYQYTFPWQYEARNNNQTMVTACVLPKELLSVLLRPLLCLRSCGRCRSVPRRSWLSPGNPHLCATLSGSCDIVFYILTKYQEIFQRKSLGLAVVKCR